MEDDEFFNLDVRKALQTSGATDPFSPSSFKNLQQTAEGLLLKLHTAYRERVKEARDARAEYEAQAEELQEAQTRAQHLKLQLSNMSNDSAEQEKVVMDLVDNLAKEKDLRMQAEAKVTLFMLDDDETGARSPRRSRKDRSSLASNDSTPSMISDSGSDFTDTSLRSPNRGVESPATPRSLSALSLSHPWKEQHPTQVILQPKGKCMSCEKLENSEAGDLTSNLKRQNKILWDRVENLEKELDGCLDFVRGLGI